MARRGQLHQATWLASSIVGGAAILTLGGPPGFILQTVHQLLAPSPWDDPSDYLSRMLEFTLFTGSTAFVVERLSRRVGNGLHFRRADLLVIGLAACIMAAAAINEHRLWLDAQREYDAADTQFLWSGCYSGPPIFPLMHPVLGIPLLFGLWCVSHTAAWSGVRGLKGVCSWMSNICGTANTA